MILNGGQVTVDDERYRTAEIVISGTDRFGNHIINNQFVHDIKFTVQDGKLFGSIVNNYDGTYTQVILLDDPVISPKINVTYRDTTVLENHLVPAIEGLTFMDELIAFNEGAEATPGANVHDNPKNAVIHPGVSQGRRTFTSLGGGGNITLAVKDKVIYDGPGNDFAVFEVAHDENNPESPENYCVEVKAGNRFIDLGEAHGGMAQFDLASKGIGEVDEIRIIDTSNRLKDQQGRLLRSPGADIEAVGVKYARNRQHDPVRKYEFNIFTGNFFISDAVGLKDSLVYGTRFMFPIRKFPKILSTYEFELGLTKTENNAGENGSILQVLGNWIFYRPFVKWAQFFVVGGGGFFKEFGFGSGTDEFVWVADAGFGFKGRISDNLYWRTDARYFFTNGWADSQKENHYQATVGLSYKFIR